MKTFRRRALPLSLLALLPALSGCVTTLEVKKIGVTQTDPPGFRYSLPVRLLQVCPGAQGAISVQEKFLPDPGNQYAISARSVASKFNLDVTVEEGLLTKFAWKPDSTGVAEKLVETSGNLAKTQIETEAKSEQAKADKLAAAEKERKDALAAADKAIRDAELEVSTAKAALDILRDRTGVDKERLAAEIALAQAEAKLAAAKEAKNQLLAANPGAIPGANDPIDSKAFGCLLYRIIEDPDPTKGVRVAAIGDQQQFETSSKVTPRKEEKKEPLELDIRETSVVRPRKDGSLLPLLLSTSLPAKIDLDSIKLRRTSDGIDITSAFKPRIAPNRGIRFRVDLPDNLPAGEYSLSATVSASGQSPAAKSVIFEVRR